MQWGVGVTQRHKQVRKGLRQVVQTGRVAAGGEGITAQYHGQAGTVARPYTARPHFPYLQPMSWLPLP
jgi:outer membrane protein W